jgi:hypothetical protein
MKNRIVAIILALSLAAFFGACGGKSKNNNNGGGYYIDTTQPVTTISSGPIEPSSKTEATFTFTCSKASCTFACSLDFADYSACVSPKSYTGLAIGNHTFRVRATDSVGNFDHNPPTYVWTIKDLWFHISGSGAPSQRAGASSIWTGSLMLVWGGIFVGAEESFLINGGIYNPATDSWTAIDTSGAPLGRVGHTAVWTGSEMIVWGGYFVVNDTEVFLDSGGRYSPETNSWIATTRTNVPAARRLHTAIWAAGPNAMIVWGGYYNDGVNDHFLKSGGIYDPALDSWGPWSSLITQTPAARAGHTVVWTGDAMIVWGGFDSVAGSNYSTGGMYLPGTMTWVSISNVLAPEARSEHSAIWTGTDMVIWGGRAHDFGQGDQYFNNGGRYSLANNRWSATSTSDAPSARAFHSAVWNGTDMIVWGGSYYDGSTLANVYFNSGGKYDPLRDHWSETNTENAPAGRTGHNVAWTGVYMLVWGGFSFDGVTATYYNDGAKYAP